MIGIIRAHEQRIAALESSLTALASSTCSTMPRIAAQSAVTFATGNTFGTAAVCTAARTYTKIRLASASGGGTAPTALVAGVWDSTGATQLATTADFSARYALSTEFEVLLTSPLTLALGQIVYLGPASVSGSSLQFRGSAGAGQVNGVAPIIARSASGYAGGALPASCGAAGTGSLIWAELI